MHINRRGFFELLVVATSLAYLALPAFAAEEKASESKLATVNGSVITEDQFNMEMSVVKQRISSRGKPISESQLLELRKNVLESLIDRELLYQQSQKNGVKVEEADVNEQLRKIKERFSNETEFKSALSKMNFSESDLKSQIERELTIKQLIDERFVQSVTISDEEAKAYYDDHPNMFKRPEQVKASHILIKVDPLADESQKAASRKKLEQIQQKLQKGENFGDLAKEFSEGPSSVKGGDLGYFTRGQMVKSFEEVAFALNKDEVSGIVLTRFGYHLIKVVDKKPESTIPYEDIRDNLKPYLKQEEVQEQVIQYIEKLKGKAKVERFLTGNSQ